MGMDLLDTLIGFALVMLGMSLLVTISVQVFNLCLQKREAMLEWGVIRFLERIGMKEAQAKSAAKLVLTDSLLSPDGKKRVAHISFEELLMLLPKQANIPQPDVTVPGSEDPGAPKVLSSSKKKLTEGWMGLLGRGGVVDSGWSLSLPDPDSATAALAETEDLARGAIARWRLLFNLAMNRTTERFVNHSRKIALVVSALLCFAFQVDSLRILEQLSTDSELRTKLAMSAELALDRAQEHFDWADATRALPAVAFAELRLEKEPDRLKKPRALLPEKLDVALDRSAVEDAIRKAIPDGKAESALLLQYSSIYEAKVAEASEQLRPQAASLMAMLEESKLVLFDLAPSPTAYFEELWHVRHLFGILISIALVSLGAPFWYNSLRRMTDLRSFLAKKEDEQQPVP